MCLITPRRQCAMQGMSQGMGERNKIQEIIEYTMMVVEMKVMHQMALFIFHSQIFNIE
jgi:hypothetical protein